LQPQKIKENTEKEKYDLKEDIYGNMVPADVNPYSGRCVFNREYTHQKMVNILKISVYILKNYILIFVLF